MLRPTFGKIDGLHSTQLIRSHHGKFVIMIYPVGQSNQQPAWQSQRPLEIELPYIEGYFVPIRSLTSHGNAYIALSHIPVPLQGRRFSDMLDRFILLLAQLRYQKVRAMAGLNFAPATTVALVQELVDACLQVLSLPNGSALDPQEDLLLTEIISMQALADSYLQVLRLSDQSEANLLDSLRCLEILFPWEEGYNDSSFPAYTNHP